MSTGNLRLGAGRGSAVRVARQADGACKRMHRWGWNSCSVRSSPAFPLRLHEFVVVSHLVQEPPASHFGDAVIGQFHVHSKYFAQVYSCVDVVDPPGSGDESSCIVVPPTQEEGFGFPRFSAEHDPGSGFGSSSPSHPRDEGEFVHPFLQPFGFLRGFFSCVFVPSVPRFQVTCGWVRARGSAVGRDGCESSRMRPRS